MSESVAPLPVALQTLPDDFEQHEQVAAALRCVRALCPDPSEMRIVDLGCLEGHFTEGFARLGFREALGIEVRAVNFAKCIERRTRAGLSNLQFAKDNAWNLANYGRFDVVFCAGLLYHIERPRAFIDLVAAHTRRAAIFNTHFAVPGAPNRTDLSELTVNEGLPGRWFVEPADIHSEVDNWSAWGVNRAFWIRREHLIQTIRDAGFPMVFEQFDLHGPELAHSLTEGYYASECRGIFVGVKDLPPLSFRDAARALARRFIRRVRRAL
jgi:SAM-dependent methyltransferase